MCSLTYAVPTAGGVPPTNSPQRGLVPAGPDSGISREPATAQGTCQDDSADQALDAQPTPASSAADGCPAEPPTSQAHTAELRTAEASSSDAALPMQPSTPDPSAEVPLVATPSDELSAGEVAPSEQDSPDAFPAELLGTDAYSVESIEVSPIKAPSTSTVPAEALRAAAVVEEEAEETFPEEADIDRCDPLPNGFV